MADHHSPRVLKVTFEFHVPPGLKANIRFARIQAAVAAFTGAVTALAPTVFPWADRIVVNKEWSYQWWAPKPDVIEPKAGAEVDAEDDGPVGELDDPDELTD